MQSLGEYLHASPELLKKLTLSVGIFIVLSVAAPRLMGGIALNTLRAWQINPDPHVSLSNRR